MNARHRANCRWEITTNEECEYRETHHYCPHEEHACDCEPVNSTKAEAILDAIRQTDVGSDIIIHNEDMSVFCILTVKCKEHPEKMDEDGGKVIK